MTHQRPDPEIPQRLAADPVKSVWVGASAGTGKTKVLTDRVLNLLLAGTPPHRLLCLTFTKAAAAEMSNRIAARLARWSTAPDDQLADELGRLLGSPPDEERCTTARRLFAQVLDAPGGMKIQTIHAFCQSLLRRFPLEAGLAPHFQVMDDRDAGELLEGAKEEVLMRARSGEDDLLAKALAEVTGHVHESMFPDLMNGLASERGRLRRMIEREGGVDGLIAALYKRLGLERGETPQAVIAAACEDSAFDAGGCRAALEALNQGSKTDVERADLMAQWLAAPEARVDGWRDWLRAYLTSTGEIRKTLCTKKVLQAAPHVADILLKEAERLLRVQDRWRAAVTAQATAGLLRLGEALLASYQRHKEGRALLDYDDLILAARRLLSAPGVSAWVLYKLDGGIDHVLIDEAQDTNPDQWAVVAALTEDFFAGLSASETLRTVFAVGDVKQSIYSFQRADPREFERMRRSFAERLNLLGDPLRLVDLQISFRSTRAVLDVVDKVFADGTGRDGVAFGDENIRHISWRDSDAGLVELWPPVEPRAIDEPEAWKPPIERIRGDSPRTRLAKLVARRIQKMVEGGERLESKNRPIRPGDIMVLLRRRSAFVEELVRELKTLKVEVAGVDRMVLTEQMAVMDLMALANFLLLPDDDLTLATVLKGPLIGLSEEDLFRLAYNRREKHLWQRLREEGAEGNAPFEAAWQMLSGLLARADRMPPHELFNHVLTAKDGRRKLVERLGSEAEDAIDEFLGLTLAYERAHVPSLQGFLHWLETGHVEIKRDLEQGTRDAVRIMTVHGSKGLQAPIVFLPDTLQAPAKAPRFYWLGGREDEVLLWPPRAEMQDEACREARAEAEKARDQEYRRLLYVAMTRAEDRLYVCGWQTRKAEPEDCWYNLIKRAMNALGEEVEDPFLAEQGETATNTLLRLSCRQERQVPEQAPKAERAAMGADSLPAWALTAPGREPSPPRPLAPSRPEGEEPPVRSPLGEDDGAKFRRGRLVHRLLQILPDLPKHERGAAMARFLAKSPWGLSFGEQALIATEVASILEDRTFAPIFGPGSRAEVPVVGMVGERVISGQVDRLLVSDSEVLIIDYKTNRRPPRKVEDVPELYLRQMAAYRMALACIYPGRAIRCGLLWTDGPSLMLLENHRLDDALSGLLDQIG
ncbi:double-strand break repair helicase AddA [Telmatospirillum sp. J64-1]|uniref:double-strand break repair helicase AddA n=1 Tax=Telmatospirillum sp. J64-1 TaxID=2502183 RepID=UPI00115E1A86|nr:double-strand break repair helicase AddA [Telmatospirillum sp. J64-1]